MTDRPDWLEAFMPEKEFHKRGQKLASDLMEEMLKRPEFKIEGVPTAHFTAAMISTPMILLQAADKAAAVDRVVYEVFIQALEGCIQAYRSGETKVASLADVAGRA